MAAGRATAGVADISTHQSLRKQQIVREKFILEGARYAANVSHPTILLRKS